MALKLKELQEAFEKATATKGKADCGDLMFEFYNTSDGDQLADLTSIICRQSRGETNHNNELSFLRFLSADFTDQPVILVSKMSRSSISEDNEKQSATISESIKSTESSLKMRNNFRKDSSDLWGSPLKCNIPNEDESVSLLSLDSSQMSMDTKKPKLKHLGIPLNLARKIVSGYNVNGNIARLHPLLVLCDGEDLHTTALLGVKQFQVPKEGTAKGFKLVTITVDRKGGGDMHNKKVKVTGGSSQTCHAVYQVNADSQKPWATAAVEMKWKGANCLLEKPPVEASTTIKASVQSGNMLRCANFYQELQFLERIITALTSGQMEWIPESSDTPTMPLTASVKAFIDTLQEEGTLGSSAAQGEQEADTWSFTTAVKFFSIPERKDHDFTDRLWKVMLNCMSTADLISSLRLVFKALGQGHFRPFVDRHNHTTVAQIVRDCFLGRYCAPSLTGVQPLLFLAEMGAEKLRRDYIQVFVSQWLATSSLLEGFTDVEQELHEKLENLGKLHSVLEMTALLGASLRLPSDTLGTIARQMLSHYHQHPVDPRHVFSFPVKTSEVRYVISSLSPVMWCLETSKMLTKEDVHESSLHCLSAKQPFLHLQADGMGVFSNKGDNLEKPDIEVDLSPAYCLVHRKETVMIV